MTRSRELVHGEAESSAAAGYFLLRNEVVLPSISGCHKALPAGGLYSLSGDPSGAGRGRSRTRSFSLMPAGMTTAKNAWLADPEKYDLLRARMGGWTEFFVTMFPAHQARHQRRPVELPEMAVAAGLSGVHE